MAATQIVVRDCLDSGDGGAAGKLCRWENTSALCRVQLDISCTAEPFLSDLSATIRLVRKSAYSYCLDLRTACFLVLMMLLQQCIVIFSV